MRDLAASSVPPITTMNHQEILTALRAPTGVIDSRFEVRDFNGRLVDVLPKVTVHRDSVTGQVEFEGTEGVLDTPGAAQFEINIDQEIPGLLRLQMLPVEDLRHAGNRYEIWPYMIHEFDGPGGQRVTGCWQFGCYVWSPPQREIGDVGLEEWTVACPDRWSLMEGQGPGIAGWSAVANSSIADDLRRLLERGGLDPDLAVLPGTGETFPKFVKWWYQEDRELKRYQDELTELQGHPEMQPDFKAKTAAEKGTKATTERRIAWAKHYIETHEVRDGDTSLGQIAGDECEAAGWESPWLDFSGRVIVAPAVTDLASVRPQHTYETGPDSIIICPVSDEVDITSVCNKGIGVATGRDVILDPLEVYLEEIDPRHPACETNGRPGVWVDFVHSDDKAASREALRAATLKDLRDRALASRRLDFSTLVNPAHEPHDFAAMRFDGDPDLAGGVTFHTRRIAGDFYDHTMTHQHFRTFASPV